MHYHYTANTTYVHLTKSFHYHFSMNKSAGRYQQNDDDTVVILNIMILQYIYSRTLII